MTSGKKVFCLWTWQDCWAVHAIDSHFKILRAVGQKSQVVDPQIFFTFYLNFWSADERPVLSLNAVFNKLPIL